MYISIRRYQTDPSVVDELMQRIDEEFVPIISSGPGFMAYYTVNGGNGVISTISVFEDLAGAQESDEKAARWVKTVPTLLPDPPTITEGQVRVHKAAHMEW
jgi:hypothetical protein